MTETANSCCPERDKITENSGSTAARSRHHHQQTEDSSCELVMKKNATTTLTFARSCVRYLELAILFLLCTVMQTRAAPQTSAHASCRSRRQARNHGLIMTMQVLLLCMAAVQGGAAFFAGPDYDARQVQGVVNDLCGRTAWWDTPNLVTRCVCVCMCTCMYVYV
jgi:hypothetical protein